MKGIWYLVVLVIILCILMIGIVAVFNFLGQRSTDLQASPSQDSASGAKLHTEFEPTKALVTIETIEPTDLEFPTRPTSVDQYHTEVVMRALLTASDASNDLFMWSYRQDRDVNWSTIATQQRVVGDLMQYAAIRDGLKLVTPPSQSAEFHKVLVQWAEDSYRTSARLIEDYYQLRLLDAGIQRLKQFEDQIFNYASIAFPGY